MLPLAFLKASYLEPSVDNSTTSWSKDTQIPLPPIYSHLYPSTLDPTFSLRHYIAATLVSMSQRPVPPSGLHDVCKKSFSPRPDDHPFSIRNILGLSAENGEATDDIKAEKNQASEKRKPLGSMENTSFSPSIVSPKSHIIPTLTCPGCEKPYSTKSGLEKHIASHCQVLHPQLYRCAENVVMCNNCDTQLEIRATECECKQCGTTVFELSENGKEAIPGKVIERACGKEYRTVGGLKMHCKTHQPEFVCSFPGCHSTFSRLWLLKGHTRTHTGHKPYSCDQCGRRFADNSNLRAHRRTHFPEQKKMCSDCGKSFARNSLLRKHKVTCCTKVMKHRFT